LAGAAAALLAVLFFRRNFSTELLTFNGFGLMPVPPQPLTTAAAWFDWFGRAPLSGLLLFDLFDLVNYGLVAVIFLALYVALRRENPGAMLAALSAGLAGGTIYAAANQTLAMRTLSARYAAAATAEEGAQLLAAGEALLAMHNPGVPAQGTGLTVALLLVLLAGLVFAWEMRRSAAFSRATAVTGILANGLTLLHFPLLLIAPGLLWLPHTLGGPLRMAWYLLIALALWRLWRVRPEPAPAAIARL
jgi:hypothetical protein